MKWVFPGAAETNNVLPEDSRELSFNATESAQRRAFLGIKTIA